MDPVEPVETGKSNRGLVVAAALALAVIVAAAAWWTYHTRPEPIKAYAGPPRYVVTPPLTHPSRETAPPWPALAPGLRERLEGAGVPYGKDETTAFHSHQHLDIYVDGSPVVVPANIGIDSQAGVISALHTHDTSGVIHAESPVERRYTLGQFFDVWGVRLSADCLGARCGELQVFVNGKVISGNPRSLVLEQLQQITISAGATDTELPASYDFSGYR